MLQKDDFEKAARIYCELMSIDPDGTVKFKGQKMKNFQVAVQQIRAHLATQLALQKTLSDKGPAPEGKLRHIVTP
jgi:hypothetical protein